MSTKPSLVSVPGLMVQNKAGATKNFSKLNKTGSYVTFKADSSPIQKSGSSGHNSRVKTGKYPRKKVTIGTDFTSFVKTQSSPTRQINQVFRDAI